MKKFMLLSFLFVATLSFFSCANDEEVTGKRIPSQENVSKSTKTLQDLQVLNEQLQKNAHVTRTSTGNNTLDADILGAIRGFSVGESIGSLGKFFGVWGNAAYASCAFAGTVVGAAAFSWRYHKRKSGCAITSLMEGQLYDKASDYCTIKTNIANGFENTETPDYILNQLHIPMGYDDIEKIGIAHNEIIQTDPLELMNSQLGDGINGNGLEKPADPIEPDRNPCLVAMFEDDDFQSEYSTSFDVFDDYYSNYYFDYSEYLDDNPLVTTNATNVLRLFMSAIHATPQTTSTMIQLVNSYIQIIENNNELTSAERKQLYIGFIVAVYSFDLWEGNPNVL